MINKNTSQQGFWEKVNGEYKVVQYATRIKIVTDEAEVDITSYVSSVQLLKQKPPREIVKDMTTLRVGDDFVIEGDALGYLHNMVKFGSIRTVISMTPTLVSYREPDNNNVYVVRVGDAHKIMKPRSQSETPAFKVGDRIEIVDHNNYGWMYDDFGTVVSVRGNDVLVHMQEDGKPSTHAGEAHILSFRTRHLKLTIEEAIPCRSRPYEFKVGDEVKVIGNAGGGHGHGIGDVGKIIHISKTGEWCIDVKVGTLGQWVKPEHLEVVRPRPHEFKVGDIVKYAKKLRGCYVGYSVDTYVEIVGELRMGWEDKLIPMYDCVVPNSTWKQSVPAECLQPMPQYRKKVVRLKEKRLPFKVGDKVYVTKKGKDTLMWSYADVAVVLGYDKEDNEVHVDLFDPIEGHKRINYYFKPEHLEVIRLKEKRLSPLKVGDKVQITSQILRDDGHIFSLCEEEGHEVGTVFEIQEIADSFMLPGKMPRGLMYKAGDYDIVGEFWYHENHVRKVN